VGPIVRGPVRVRPDRAHPYIVRPYYRPYLSPPYYSGLYAFRPQPGLALGIVTGYPVPYFAYPHPVDVFGYAAPVAPVIVGPDSAAYGGLSLEISPASALVYVDGGYAGLVGDFNGTREPLTLALGTHHIEIDAAGYQPWAFDVDVAPGQILPYRGALQPLQ
jgi:hypothetical protein